MLFSKETGESLTYKFAQTANEMKAAGKEILSFFLVVRARASAPTAVSHRLLYGVFKRMVILQRGNKV